MQAAWSSAVAFATGAALPLVAAALAPGSVQTTAIVLVTLVALALLGTTGVRLGGAPPVAAALRVRLWGMAAMTVTYGIGAAGGTLV